MRHVVPALVLSAALAACGTTGRPAPETAREPAHPLVAAVEGYLQARKSDDPDAVRPFLAGDSRVWFGTREGEGNVRTVSGEGPWTKWDRFFRSRSRILQTEVLGDTAVAVVSEETNDWYRLLDRPPKKLRVTYFFDPERRIAGTLIQSADPETPPFSRQPEFEAWLRETHPGELAFLMPDGELDPSPDRARRWRKLLTEWRAATGLPPVE